MTSQTIVKQTLRIGLACMLMIFLFSCSSKEEYAGIYQTGEADEELRSELELKEDGDGFWRVGGNEEQFSWYPKGDEIRLNTKKGGVIVADIEGDSLLITLSGGKKFRFKKIE